MASSTIGQFRSKVQWFLEGNTPNNQDDLIVDLLVCLKTFAQDLKNSAASDPANSSLLESISTDFSSLSRAQLVDSGKIRGVVSAIDSLVSAGANTSIDTKSFRDLMVKLILIAEISSDTSFKRQLLDLTEKL